MSSSSNAPAPAQSFWCAAQHATCTDLSGWRAEEAINPTHVKHADQRTEPLADQPECSTIDQPTRNLQPKLEQQQMCAGSPLKNLEMTPRKDRACMTLSGRVAPVSSPISVLTQPFGSPELAHRIRRYQGQPMPFVRPTRCAHRATIRMNAGSLSKQKFTGQDQSKHWFVESQPLVNRSEVKNGKSSKI